MRRTMLVVIVTVMPAACSKKTDPPSPSLGQPKTTASKTRSEPKTQSACELLKASEMAGFLKVGEVTKDEINSGKNEMTKVDFCTWNAKPEGGLELRLRRAESTDEGAAMLLFSAAKGDAVEHDPERSRKAETLSGVGDEAIYSAFGGLGKGGSIALRIGSRAVTITASASKDDLVAMAKLVASRL